MLELNKIYNIDCLVGMTEISDGSIDMIFVDLPYGVTAKNKWDNVIPYEPMWKQFERIIKPNGAILLFGQDKFTARTMLSNEKLHKYNIVLSSSKHFDIAEYLRNMNYTNIVLLDSIPKIIEMILKDVDTISISHENIIPYLKIRGRN